WNIRSNLRSLREKFRQQFFILVDNLASALQGKSQGYEELYNKFGFLSDLANLSRADISKAATNLVEAYPEDVDESLNPDICLDESDKDHNQELFTFIQPMVDTFVNVITLLKIYLCVVHNSFLF
ncbi:hypothetical protein Hamer_G026124, partial [Homarus americanus]